MLALRNLRKAHEGYDHLSLYSQQDTSTMNLVVGRVSLTNIGTVSWLEWVVHAIHLLLVADEMLDGSNNTLLLNTLDSQRAGNTLKDGIGAEAFPVAATERLTTQRTNRGAKEDVGSFAAELFTYGNSTSIDKVLVKRRSRRDTSRECRIMVGIAHTESTILQTQLRKANSVRTATISYTSADGEVRIA